MGRLFLFYLLIIFFLFFFANIFLKTPFRLPGDILIKGKNYKVFIPIGTSIIFSIILTIVLNIIKR